MADGYSVPIPSDILEQLGQLRAAARAAQAELRQAREEARRFESEGKAIPAQLQARITRLEGQKQKWAVEGAAQEAARRQVQVMAHGVKQGFEKLSRVASARFGYGDAGWWGGVAQDVGANMAMRGGMMGRAGLGLARFGSALSAAALPATMIGMLVKEAFDYVEGNVKGRGEAAKSRGELAEKVRAALLAGNIDYQTAAEINRGTRLGAADLAQRGSASELFQYGWNKGTIGLPPGIAELLGLTFNNDAQEMRAVAIDERKKAREVFLKNHPEYAERMSAEALTDSAAVQRRLDQRTWSSRAWGAVTSYLLGRDSAREDAVEAAQMDVMKGVEAVEESKRKREAEYFQDPIRRYAQLEYQRHAQAIEAMQKEQFMQWNPY